MQNYGIKAVIKNIFIKIFRILSSKVAERKIVKIYGSRVLKD